MARTNRSVWIYFALNSLNLSSFLCFFSLKNAVLKSLARSEITHTGPRAYKTKSICCAFVIQLRHCHGGRVLQWTRQANKFHLPLRTTTAEKHKILYNSAKVWNELTNNITNKNTFKNPHQTALHFHLWHSHHTTQCKFNIISLPAFDSPSSFLFSI